MQEAYGKDDYDTTARRCIIDGDKGATASFKKYLALGKWFSCAYHRKARAIANAQKLAGVHYFKLLKSHKPGQVWFLMKCT